MINETTIFLVQNSDKNYFGYLDIMNKMIEFSITLFCRSKQYQKYFQRVYNLRKNISKRVYNLRKNISKRVNNLRKLYVYLSCFIIQSC